MNYYGIRTIERFIGEIESFFKIKILENKLEKFLKKKNVSCYKLLTYDLIFWILSLVITVYFLKDYIEEYLDSILSV